MSISIYQVDAFSNQLFGGNPAAICPLQSWLIDEKMQKIAAENNLSETAFFVQKEDLFELRWFTPTTEVELCGHATLATAHVIFEHLNYQESTIRFSTLSGILTVKKEGGKLVMNFPADKLKAVEPLENINEILGAEVLESYKGNTDYLLILENEKIVAELKPNFYLLGGFDCRAIIVSAKGETTDFVSRVFAPQCGIDEDPVTGSAHTTMIPYWANKLGKRKLYAEQISSRKGKLWCQLLGDRVEIAGEGITYLKGEIEV